MEEKWNLFSTEAKKWINEEYNSSNDCHGSFSQSDVSGVWLSVSIEILNYESTSCNEQGTADQTVENVLQKEQCLDKHQCPGLQKEKSEMV